MKALLKELLGSKKFWMTVTTVIVYVVGKFGLDVAFDDLWPIMAALMTFVLGQGVADINKHAPLPPGATGQRVATDKD